MKRSQLCLIFLLFFIYSFTGNLFAQQAAPAAISVIKQMHTRYFRGPCKSYTFSQRNTHYRNDSVIKHSQWHESIEFPDKFKIIFGDTADGNFVVFKNDSAFNHKKGKLLQSRRDSNMVLFLIGGMYYRPFKDVV